MEKFFYSLLVIVILTGCGSTDHGELIGIEDREQWYPSDPYGMVYIPMGNFRMGLNEQDVPYSLTAPTKSVSVAAFYMDATEITNNEYRQFVHWVRDSILRTNLAEEYIEGYEYKLQGDDAPKNPTAWQEFVDIFYPEEYGSRLNWDVPLVWDANRYPEDEAYIEVVELSLIHISEPTRPY